MAAVQILFLVFILTSPLIIGGLWPIKDPSDSIVTRAEMMRSNELIIREQYEVIPELTVRVRNKRPYAHIRLGPDYKAEDVQWLNEQQALLEIPTLPFVRM